MNIMSAKINEKQVSGFLIPVHSHHFKHYLAILIHTPSIGFGLTKWKKIGFGQRQISKCKKQRLIHLPKK